MFLFSSDLSITVKINESTIYLFHSTFNQNSSVVLDRKEFLSMFQVPGTLCVDIQIFVFSVDINYIITYFVSKQQNCNKSSHHMVLIKIRHLSSCFSIHPQVDLTLKEIQSWIFIFLSK